MIGVALGGGVVLGGRVGAAVRVAATIVATRLGGGSPAERLQADNIIPAIMMRVRKRCDFME
jgi:uncharacterized protein YcfJ